MDYQLKTATDIPPLDKTKADKFYILINLFIKRGHPDSWTQKDWLRERTACKSLMRKYPDFDFFYSLSDVNGKFNSLLGLISVKYNNWPQRYKSYIDLKNKTKSFTLDSNHVTILDSPVKKAKNLLEFLDN